MNSVNVIFVSGLSLVRFLSSEKYRIILKDIHIIYHYQAKTNVFAQYDLNKSLLEELQQELKNADALFREFNVDVYDVSNNHICTGIITWQLKNWSKVKTVK